MIARYIGRDEARGNLPYARLPMSVERRLGDDVAKTRNCDMRRWGGSADTACE